VPQNNTTDTANENEGPSRREWLASLQKGDKVRLEIHTGSIQWSQTEKAIEVVLTRAGRKYFEVGEEFDGNISRETGRGKDSHNRNAIITPIPA